MADEAREQTAPAPEAAADVNSSVAEGAMASEAAEASGEADNEALTAEGKTATELDAALAIRCVFRCLLDVMCDTIYYKL